MSEDDALSEFYEMDLITSVVGQLKAGKEAQVYVCRAHPDTGYELLAAKVYKSREFRSFQGETTYLEGRASLMRGRARSSSVTRAIERRSRAGRALLESTWVRREYAVLRRMRGAGARVPEPLAVAGRAVLMAYVGDEETAAPRLQAVELPIDVATSFREILLQEVELFLRADLIHGDLSPYNVLVWRGEPWIIDVPQAVDAPVHPDGGSLLRRDICNLTRYFARCGIPDDGDSLAEDLWRRYERGQL